MLNTRGAFLFLSFYFVILLLLAPINLLSLDTYYYWEWSRHLALSYYDGSPMIAYMIKLATLLFGDTFLALSITGIIVTALTSIIIYKTGRLFLTPHSSYIAMLSWLLSPLATMDLLTQTTYDTPLILFWAFTLYYVTKYIKNNQTSDLYFAGASIGLMLLSKYTGVILVLALILFIFSSYRSLLKTKHFYLAMLLSTLFFSPVIIWNYQHQWLSFTYQLTTHKLNPAINPFYHVASTLFEMFLPALNFMLLPLLMTRNEKTAAPNTLIIKLCRTVSITVLCFYIYTAFNAELRVFWLTPYLISGALLFGYWFEKGKYQKQAILILILYGIVSIGMLVNNTYKFSFIPSKKQLYYDLMQELNRSYPQLPDIILTAGWFEARKLFFLKNKPEVYTLGCGAPQNQYALWGADVHQKLKNKTIKEALYVDRYIRPGCLEQYFDQCTLLPIKPYPYRKSVYSLNVYRCINK